ncbi:hypothetical protein CC80DRAFT_567503 [Byssothecium circinans]|uniref:MFS general substrate transporter n=1 Tax=Byssothecium circinans TaxID=147558 RepID=A0A6A5TRN2_9PLEO|nr:hypothetical protein CC80DRAFT_567503 [Byssothecium circinans]
MAADEHVSSSDQVGPHEGSPGAGLQRESKDQGTGISRVPSVGVASFQDKVASMDLDPAMAVTGGEILHFSSEEEALNYASLMGIQEDTHLKPNSQQYSWASSIFYAGYIFYEFPTTYLLRRLPIAKYTSTNVILWGIVLTLHAVVTNYAGLLVVRFFLGVFEATVTPAFVLITSMWFKQALFSILMNIPNGGITTFGSLTINSFGFGPRMALLLGAPSGVFDIGGKLLFTWLSDKYRDRSMFACIAILFAMVGGILMITLPQDAKAGLLVGYYMVSVAGASWGLVMVVISNNTLGYTKKATVNGLQILAYGAGNWIGPQTFRSSQAPEYYSGKLMVAVMYGAAAGLDPLTLIKRGSFDLCGTRQLQLKISGNILVLGFQGLIAEAQVFAEKTGLGTARMQDFIGTMFGPVLESYSKRITSSAWAPPLGMPAAYARDGADRLTKAREVAGDELDSTAVYGAARLEAGLPFWSENSRQGN